MKHTKQQAGSKGGRATVSRYGSEHMRAIGRKGASVTWSRYFLSPVGLNQFAMVNRQTGIVKTIKDG